MTQGYIGAPVRRKEDVRFLTGQASYLDDIKRPGMLHAAILRSPHAYARIISIDTKEALSMPGVSAVITYDDLPASIQPIPVRIYDLPGLDRCLQSPLARDKVRYADDPVAVVVADNRYIAGRRLGACFSRLRASPGRHRRAGWTEGRRGASR